MLAFAAGAMFNIVADELTFQYNKSRQQKTTAEILDHVGGLQRWQSSFLSNSIIDAILA